MLVDEYMAVQGICPCDFHLPFSHRDVTVFLSHFHHPWLPVLVSTSGPGFSVPSVAVSAISISYDRPNQCIKARSIIRSNSCANLQGCSKPGSLDSSQVDKSHRLIRSLYVALHVTHRSSSQIISSFISTSKNTA